MLHAFGWSTRTKRRSIIVRWRQWRNSIGKRSICDNKTNTYNSRVEFISKRTLISINAFVQYMKVTLSICEKIYNVWQKLLTIGWYLLPYSLDNSHVARKYRLVCWGNNDKTTINFYDEDRNASMKRSIWRTKINNVALAEWTNVLTPDVAKQVEKWRFPIKLKNLTSVNIERYVA